MKDKPRGSSAAGERHLERLADEIGLHVVGDGRALEAPLAAPGEASAGHEPRHALLSTADAIATQLSRMSAGIVNIGCLPLESDAVSLSP